jgi:hypothetical protein
MANPSTVRQFVIAALVCSALLTGAFSLIAMSIPPTQRGNYTQYNNTFNKFEEMRLNAENISGRMENAQPTKATGDESLLAGMWDATFGTVKQVWTSITTVNAMITDLGRGGSPINMPQWFTGLLITIIGVIVTYAIIASIRKWHV